MEDITSGWLLRFLFLFPNYKREIKDAAIMTPEGREAYNRMKQHFEAIRDFFKSAEVEFTLPPSGMKKYNDWRRHHEGELMESGDPAASQSRACIA